MLLVVAVLVVLATARASPLDADKRTFGSKCTYDRDCHSEMVCYNGVCTDNCEDICGVVNANCKIIKQIDHVPMCRCKEGYNVEVNKQGRLECKPANPRCTKESDCKSHQFCYEGYCNDNCEIKCEPGFTCEIVNHWPSCVWKNETDSDFQSHPNWNLLPHDECGKRSFIAPRVIGGTNARPGEFPWMAKLYSKEYLMCGASIISKRYILTAAHCCEGSLIPTHVGVGTLSMYQYSDEKVYEAEDIIIYDKYGGKPLGHINDFCLIRLKEPIEFTENISPICLPEQKRMGEVKFVGQHLETAGWGSIQPYAPPYPKGKLPQSLQKTTLAVYDLPTENCRRDVDPNYFYCGKTLSWNKDKFSNVHKGDSGGPLMFHDMNKDRYYIIGVASKIDNETTFRYDSYFAKVSNEVIGWILNKMKR